MSERDGDKPFEPTQSRLAKARRDGDVPRSAELSASAGLAAALAGLLLAAPNIAQQSHDALTTAAREPLQFPPAVHVVAIVAWALVPAIAAAFGASALTFGQGGGLRVGAIRCEFGRLSPAAGFKRMVSREAVANAARALIAAACILAALLPMLARLFFAGPGIGSALGIATAVWEGAMRCGFAAAVVGALFGGVDLAFIVARWRKRLRMSFEEIKRDHKEHDGDPQAKSRRRSMHRAISRSSLKRLKDAAFVVVNPTHVAVALEYHPPDVAVPRVLLRAADEAALRVREAAAEQKIPIVEDVALARALYRTVKAGEFIPKENYVAVAEIVAALTRTGALLS